MLRASGSTQAPHVSERKERKERKGILSPGPIPVTAAR